MIKYPKSICEIVLTVIKTHGQSDFNPRLHSIQHNYKCVGTCSVTFSVPAYLGCLMREKKKKKIFLSKEVSLFLQPYRDRCNN